MKLLSQLLTLSLFPAASLHLHGADTKDLSQSPASLVRSFAGGAVQWLPWSVEAQERAKREGRLLFVHIGSSSSELGQAMLRQSFSNEKVAAELNDAFVCVVVDRDEYPGLSSLYQSYVSTKKQITGWPLNLWLTPDLKPVDGATYLPPSEEWGKEGFVNALQRVGSSWKNDQEAQLLRADDAVAEIVAAEYVPAPVSLEKSGLQEKLDAGFAAWVSAALPGHGGFGESPFHPEPELLRALLQREGSESTLATEILKSMAASPLNDSLGGGFFRYSTEAGFAAPYPQKHAADQARLALAFLDAYQLTKDKWAAQAAQGALDFALEHLRHPDGSFFQTWDGTSEAARKDRAAARIDQNRVAVTQGLLLSALARAHEVLGRKEYLEAARASAQYIRSHLLHSASGQLKRLHGSDAWAVPQDYAAIAYGLLALNRVAPDPAQTKWAHQLLDTARTGFFDGNVARFHTASTGERGIWHRPYSIGAASGEIPTAETLAILALLSDGQDQTETLAAFKSALASGLVTEFEDPSGRPNGGALLAGQMLLRSLSK